jgi:hypothetical protein
MELREYPALVSGILIILVGDSLSLVVDVPFLQTRVFWRNAEQSRKGVIDFVYSISNA